MLTGLLDAFSDRKRRELQEQGTVTALAHHDPQGLQALNEPAVEGPTEDPIAEYRERRKERHGE